MDEQATAKSVGMDTYTMAAKVFTKLRHNLRIGGSSRSFEGDFSEWLRLLVMESYENIKKDYLDNSKPRALKYEILIKYFKEYGWDIQAAGNKYRTEFNKYKASLPSED